MTLNDDWSVFHSEVLTLVSAWPLRFTCRRRRSVLAGSERVQARSRRSCWESSNTSSAPWEVKEDLREEIKLRTSPIKIPADGL